MHRRLHRDEVGPAGDGIDPVVRRDLRARGERDHHVVREVALREAVLGEARAIDIQPQLGRGDVLVQMHVDGAGNLRDALAQLAGDLQICRLVVAGDAHVDRRLQAEVQDLADDVGRLKIEGEMRELRAQCGAQIGGVGGRAFLPLVLERDEDFAVVRAERGAVAERHVVLLGRHADVVDDHLHILRRE